jgi:hypothetical protein
MASLPIRILILFLTLTIFNSCRNQDNAASSPASETTKESVQKSEPPAAVKYTEISNAAGVRFKHNNGAFGQKYLPESMGSGAAFFDYNNDGWNDILLINSMDWPEHRKSPSYPGLFRNNKNGTFSDVTKDAGLAVEMYGLGVTAADYDNDGDADVFISCLGQDRLFRNRGDGTFEDYTKQAGLNESEFGNSSTWFDYDNDGWLDLYVCNYVQWSPETDLFCTLDGTNKSYCTPESYKGATPRLYRNRGDGTLEDVTEKAGLFDPKSKALGVIAFDYDNDNKLDLFVANDTQPNKLYHNNGNGTFSEKGVMAGVAFSETGVARAGMGVDAADYSGTGYAGLLVGNFSNEMIGLYHNEGTGLFIDEAPATTVGQASLLTLTFGAFFFDYDLDGRIDIFAANGHVHDDIDKVQKEVHYAQPPHLFRNLGNKKFQPVDKELGSDFIQPIVARGAAYGDMDQDGDLDIIISTNGGAARLLRNDRQHPASYIRFRTTGKKSNRDGIGTRVTVHLPDGSKQWQIVKSGSSYCSQSELPLTFGLGNHPRAALVEVLWPGGAKQRLQDVTANQTITLTEP